VCVCLVSVCLRVGMFVLLCSFFCLEFREVVAGVYSNEKCVYFFSSSSPPLFSH